MLDKEFKNLKRTAILLKPERPFLEWLLMHDPGIEVYEDMLEGEIYLLPDFETIEEMVAWLYENFDALFTEQLSNWYTDESMWPANRTPEMFAEWFSYSLHTMVFDTQKGDVEKI